MTDQPKLLLAEDEPNLASMLSEMLSSEGYRVVVAADGQRALHEGLIGDFDLLLLDRGLPGVEGLDLLGRLRRHGVTAPALILSALASPADRVDGLDGGAEDYLGKPFDFEELFARLRSLLRRHSESSVLLPVPGGRLALGDRTVHAKEGKTLLLSERESALLTELARHPKQIFGRGVLLDVVFEGAGNESVVDTYVHYLRKKLGRSAILTVRGLGYRLGDL